MKALLDVDSLTALNEARRLATEPSKGALSNAIMTVIIAAGDESSADLILSRFAKMPLTQNKFSILPSISDFIARTKNTDIVKKAIDEIVSFRDAMPDVYKQRTDTYINGMILKGLVTKKLEAGLKDQADYIKSKLPEEDKKGF